MIPDFHLFNLCTCLLNCYSFLLTMLLFLVVIIFVLLCVISKILLLKDIFNIKMILYSYLLIDSRHSCIIKKELVFI